MDGSNLFGSTALLVVLDALWDVCGDCLRFRERSNPLVIVKYVCSGVFFLLTNMNY